MTCMTLLVPPLTVHAGGRYPSQRLPKVKFINGRELLVCPEKFSADYSQLGVCTRVQVCTMCSHRAALVRQLAGRDVVDMQGAAQNTHLPNKDAHHMFKHTMLCPHIFQHAAAPAAYYLDSRTEHASKASGLPSRPSCYTLGPRRAPETLPDAQHIPSPALRTPSTAHPSLSGTPPHRGRARRCP